MLRMGVERMIHKSGIKIHQMASNKLQDNDMKETYISSDEEGGTEPTQQVRARKIVFQLGLRSWLDVYIENNGI